MQTKEYYEHLGLTYHSQESGKNGIEYKFNCPWCDGKKSLSVNATNALWQCWAGCGKGNAYSFTKKLNPSQPPRDIFATMEQFGILSGQSNIPNAKAAPKKPIEPRLARKDCQALTRPEIESFCEIKGIDVDSFWTLRPFRHATKPWVLIPMHDPAASKKPCGYIRAGIDGQPVEIRFQEDGVWKSRTEKYPVIAGSNCGLVGLRHIIDKDYKTIVFCEGWKDLLAVRYFGFAAVTCGMGAGKYRDSWGQIFSAKHVLVIGDADKGGVDGAAKVSKEIHRRAKSVKNVVLPFEYKPKGGLDLHDYFSGVENNLINI